MDDLVKSINTCKGVDRCFGKVQQDRNGTKIRPLVFGYQPEEVKIMVITEQPGAGPEDERSAQDIKKTIQNDLETGPENRVPRKLKQLLGDAFKDSIVSERGAFYWTHFIKCPGSFRELKHGLDPRACAEAHLQHEIRELSPRLIICVGKEVSCWVLDLINVKRDWKDVILDQLCKANLPLYSIPLDSSLCKPPKTQVAFLFHPAERSGIGRRINLRLKDTLQQTTRKILSSSR